MTTSVWSCSPAFSPSIAAVAAIEIDRNNLKGFTIHLNQFLEWEQ